MPAHTLTSRHAWGRGRVEAVIEQEQRANREVRPSRGRQPVYPGYTELRVVVCIALIGGRKDAGSDTGTRDRAIQQRKTVRHTIRQALTPVRACIDVIRPTHTTICISALVRQMLGDGELRDLLTPVRDALRDVKLIPRCTLHYSQQIDGRRGVLITLQPEWMS
jgi:hypothetical protein